MKTSIPPVLIAFALVCFALSPKVQAVVPAPDGGYPNFTTAEGTKALFSLTTGSANTAVGWYSLFSTSSGSFNTAVGAGALDLNTADNNTAVGVAALLLNTTGINNTANGVAALVFNNTGEENTATGAFALNNNTEGDFNTADGAFALLVNTTGERNTATGDSAMFSNTTGNRNTAVGNAALGLNTTGTDNTAIGTAALSSNNASDNTAIGADALSANTTGINNTAIGNGAGSSITTGTDNICIGNGVSGVAGESFAIRIGDNFPGGPGDSSCYIGGINNQFSPSGIAVLINTSGKLGTMTPSSKRFKEDIKPMDKASEALFSLKPVTFRYKKEIDPAGAQQFGLVAEDVEKLNPDLIVRDESGRVNSVRYEAVNAMLLNEFLKEHHKVEQLTKDFQSNLAEQQKQIEGLTTSLQKVSAQLEVSKPASQVVNNP